MEKIGGIGMYILIIALVLAVIVGGIAFIVSVSEWFDIANGDE